MHRPKAQTTLPLVMDVAPELEIQMREFFNARWLHWHPSGNFEEAMKDAITKKLLVLTVMHLPQNTCR